MKKTGWFRNSSQLTSTVDLILVDARSAATSPLPQSNLAAEENVVVISNRAESITDAYTIIKLLHREYGQHASGVLISCVVSLSGAGTVPASGRSGRTPYRRPCCG